MNNSTLTQVQEVYFTLCDLLNSGQIDDIRIKGFQEYKTLSELVIEQCDKLAGIESDIKDALGEPA